MNDTDNHRDNPTLKTDPFAATCAILMLRIWLGIRCLQAGIEKYAGIKQITKRTEVDGAPDPNGMETIVEQKFYALQNYSGVPTGLAGKFQNEPLITEWFLKVYDQLLGPLLILTGLCVLLGLATRLSLLAMGLIYTSLTFGLILLNQASGIAWLGTHMVLVTLALLVASYNRFELGNLFARHTGFDCLRNK